MKANKDITVYALSQENGLPCPQPEFRFDAKRRWRFDYAWEDEKVALEIVGGVWIRGHHSRGKDQIADMEKFNEAQILGWLVLQATPQQVNSGEAFAVVKRALDSRKVYATKE